MAQNRRNNNRRPAVQKDFRPTKQFVVAVPVSDRLVEGERIKIDVYPEVRTIPATNRGSAIEMAKQILVKDGILAPNIDIRFTAVATEIVAQVGDSFGGAEAIARARKTSIVTLGEKVLV